MQMLVCPAIARERAGGPSRRRDTRQASTNEVSQNGLAATAARARLGPGPKQLNDSIADGTILFAQAS